MRECPALSLCRVNAMLISALMSGRASFHMALWLGVAATASSAELSSREKQLKRYVDGHTEETIELLARIVNINSGTMNPDGVRAVGESLELDSLPVATARAALLIHRLTRKVQCGDEKEVRPACV